MQVTPEGPHVVCIAGVWEGDYGAFLRVSQATSQVKAREQLKWNFNETF